MIRIGISPSYDENTGVSSLGKSYISAVLDAGALPVILPLHDDENMIREMVLMSDGIILSGGADVNPALYGEEILLCCGSLAPSRDKMEVALIRETVRQRKPFLAICRGIQVLNTAFGGTLYQDLATQLSDRILHPNFQKPCDGVHEVNIAENTLLHEIIGNKTLSVNSRHHQGVKKMADCFEMDAAAPDGLTESIHMKDYPFGLGVQWHPESMFDRYPDHRKIFAAFIAACGTDKA